MCYYEQLLRRNPERRLGSGEKDAEEVKKQPFFRVSKLVPLSGVFQQENDCSACIIHPCSLKIWFSDQIDKSMSISCLESFFMWSNSRIYSVCTSINSSDVLINHRHSWLTESTCLFAKERKKKKKRFGFSILFLRLSPEHGLGGAAAEESATPLCPLHRRQGRRQQLRRRVHHWSAGAHTSSWASRALPQRPGQLPGFWLRLWPLLVGMGGGSMTSRNACCWRLRGGHAGADRQSLQTVSWLFVCR